MGTKPLADLERTALDKGDAGVEGSLSGQLSAIYDLNRSHVLVVGGTGMLQGDSLYLASQGNIVSVIARHSLSLNRLAEAARTLDGHINPIQVDYEESAIFRAKLKQAVKTFGPMTSAVCWIHRNAPEAPYLVAESIDQGQMACRYFDILGSAAAGLLDRVSQRKGQVSAFQVSNL